MSKKQSAEQIAEDILAGFRKERDNLINLLLMYKKVVAPYIETVEYSYMIPTITREIKIDNDIIEEANRDYMRLTNNTKSPKKKGKSSETISEEMNEQIIQQINESVFRKQIKRINPFVALAYEKGLIDKEDVFTEISSFHQQVLSKTELTDHNPPIYEEDILKWNMRLLGTLRGISSGLEFFDSSLRMTNIELLDMINKGIGLSIALQIRMGNKELDLATARALLNQLVTIMVQAINTLEQFMNSVKGAIIKDLVVSDFSLEYQSAEELTEKITTLLEEDMTRKIESVETKKEEDEQKETEKTEENKTEEEHRPVSRNELYEKMKEEVIKLGVSRMRFTERRTLFKNYYDIMLASGESPQSIAKYVDIDLMEINEYYEGKKRVPNEVIMKILETLYEKFKFVPDSISTINKDIRKIVS